MKNIAKVFLYCEMEQIFSQADTVVEWLSWSKAKATNIIRVLKAAKVIEKMNGLGSEKYMFIEITDCKEN